MFNDMALTSGDLLLMEPTAARRLLEVLAEVRNLSEAEIAARLSAARPGRPADAPGAVAVIAVSGPLFPRASFLGALLGWTSYEEIRAAVREAAASPSIASIMLHINSTGGAVHGATETADVIRAARERKPVIAAVDSVAASAAYWLASQAEELVVTPSGEVGSVGVVAIHEDLSGAAQKAGLRVTLIATPAKKTEGNPFEPLAPEARSYIAGRVEEAYASFVRGVALGRNVPEARVRSGFGEGRMVSAPRAVALGMADAVGTFEATLARMVTAGPRAGARALAAGFDRDLDARQRWHMGAELGLRDDTARRERRARRLLGLGATGPAAG